TLRHKVEIIFFGYLHASIVFFLLGVIQEHRNSSNWLYMFDSTPTIWNTIALILLFSLIGDLIWDWRQRPKILKKYVLNRKYSSFMNSLKNWFK
ncbi:MAG: hypothetical protein SWY16_23575, partial [Cyanobacteriota bacterium]|nr:hypothetical protein [Cyanobacteriota bacterium]